MPGGERHDPDALAASTRRPSASWALPLFYLGATVTLYGTIFAATAAHSRVYADFCRLLGLFERDDYADARRATGAASWCC